MSYKTVGAKARQWATDHPHLAVAVANLRGQAGMSEDAIYHTLQHAIAEKDRPSIRQLRGAFEQFDVGHLTIAGEKGRRIAYKDRRVEEGMSRYRENRKEQYSEQQMDRLNRKLVAGYLIHAEVPAQEWADPDAYIEWEADQSYEATPPF
jgi:hypothetical protein